MNCKNLLTLLFLLSTSALWAQIAEEKVLENTNKVELTKLSAKFAAKAVKDKQEAIKIAKKNGWPIRQKLKNGKEIELKSINERGVPVYYETHNDIAARTLSTNRVYSGGGLGLNLTGLGMTVGEWDGGAVRTTHQEFGGRVTQMDGASTLSDHATHVGGTMIAAGIDSDARGMAFQGNLDAYDWTNDNSEMATAAANGLLVSNHSYGSINGWYYDDTDWYWYGETSFSNTEDYKFGYYDQGNAEAWDQIAYNAPYYLIVKSAGNDRGDTHSGTHFVFDQNSGTWVTSTASRPADGGTAGYDCIANGGTAKNVLTVGAVRDIAAGYSSAGGVVMTSFSGWGPTDDGRIKPDVVGNGYIVYSTGSASNSDYADKSGTSMSSPNVSGSLILLQQHYNALNSAFMRSASLKGLTIHTADEAGTATGPDYTYGWGLMNTATAAQFITDNDKEIIETNVTNGGSYTKNFYNDGSKIIRATICWTDLKANALPINASVLDNSTRRLINDLDIRITGPSGTFQPYILNPSSPSSAATTGDNDRDNVEQIYIAVPASGNYSLVVTHKGTLSTAQNFSLIFEGATTQPSNEDAGISAILNPTRYVCDNPFLPQVVLENFGSTTLTSATINYQIDGGAVNTQAWIGSLAAGATTTVTLPSTTVTSGASFTFAAYTSNPNGLTDGDPSNDGSNVSSTHLPKNTLPYSEGFNAGVFPSDIDTLNNGNAAYFWDYTADATASGAGAGFGSFMMDNFSSPTNMTGDLDWFFLPVFDLSAQSNNQLTFDIAYAPYSAGNSDTLIVAINSDCGGLFTPVYYRGGADLSTAAAQTNGFTPTTGQWRTETIDLSAYAGQANVRVAFINKSGWGNRMFVDDINLPSGTIIAVHDAGIDSIANPIDSSAFCTSPFVPEVQIRNFGTSTLTSANINYQIDNGTVSTFAWTGSLAPNAAEMVTLPAVVGPGTGTPFTFKVYTTNPNGGTDVDVNNDLSSVYTQEIQGQALPYMEAVDAGTVPTGLAVGQNPPDAVTWGYSTTVSGYGTGIGVPATNNGTLLFNNYNTDTRNTLDFLYLPWLSFAGQTGVQMTFDVAYARYDATLNDTLIVLISTDCGQSYQELYRKGGSDLATAPDEANAFEPTSGQWRTETIPMGAYDGSSHVRVAFMNVGGYGNIVYVDNINVQAAVTCNLAATVSASTAVSCNSGSDGSLTVVTAGGTPAYSYNIGSGNQASSTLTGLAAGSYTITVTDGAGCTATAFGMLSEPTVVTGTVTSQQNVSCFGTSTGSATIAGSGGTGTGYTYNRGTGAQASGTFTGLAAGSYTVTVLDNNACIGTVGLTITQPASAVAATASSINSPTCFGGTGSTTITGSGGTPSYTFNIGSGTQSNGNFTGLTAGSYTVTVTDALGCQATTNVNITQPTAINTSVSSSSDASCNGATDGAVTLTATGGSGAGYTFNLGTGAQASGVFTGLGVGNYTATVMDGNGCSTTLPVNVNAASTAISVSSSVNINVSCNGGSDGSATATSINGSGAVTYVWSQGFTGATTTALASGTYTITATDAAGCSDVTTVAITEPTLLTATTTDNGNGSATVNATGGTATYNYLWDANAGSQTTATANSLTGGTYNVTITDANGCIATSSVTVIITGVEDVPNITAFEVRPNPNTGQFTVQVNLLERQAAIVQVTNVLGQRLLEFSKDAQEFSIPIDLQNQVSGVYFITLSTDKKSITKKVIVDK